MDTRTAPGQEVTDREYRQIVEFLYHEAQLLDARRLTEWLALMTADIRYRVLAPTVRMLEEKEQDRAKEVTFLNEDMGTLQTRVLQLSTPAYTVAENPPSFTRRFVTNIFVTRGAGQDRFEVSSNLLLYRSKGTSLSPYLFSAERQDMLQRVDGQLRLAQRTVWLDEAVLGTRNMSVFF